MSPYVQALPFTPPREGLHMARHGGLGLCMCWVWHGPMCSACQGCGDCWVCVLLMGVG